MPHQHRPRRYVSPVLITTLRPLFRRSETRDAYVLRAIGNHAGPVLREDRRRGRRPTYEGAERRLA